jgi:hypothetical protein
MQLCHMTYYPSKPQHFLPLAVKLIDGAGLLETLLTYPKSIGS